MDIQCFFIFKALRLKDFLRHKTAILPISRHNCATIQPYNELDLFKSKSLDYNCASDLRLEKRLCEKPDDPCFPASFSREYDDKHLDGSSAEMF